MTILGVSHTAPFSPWSFGDYLSRMLPLLWIGALFFLTFFTSAKARRAAVLTDAAPMPPQPVRPGPVRRRPDGDRAAGAGCALREAAVFYGRISAGTAGASLLLPALVDPAARRWCSHWAAAGCWGGCGPGWSMSGWLVPSCLAALPLPEVAGALERAPLRRRIP